MRSKCQTGLNLKRVSLCSSVDIQQPTLKTSVAVVDKLQAVVADIGRKVCTRGPRIRAAVCDVFCD
jgi:hypothetical protein